MEPPTFSAVVQAPLQFTNHNTRYLLPQSQTRSISPYLLVRSDPRVYVRVAVTSFCLVPLSILVLVLSNTHFIQNGTRSQLPPSLPFTLRFTTSIARLSYQPRELAPSDALTISSLILGLSRGRCDHQRWYSEPRFASFIHQLEPKPWLDPSSQERTSKVYRHDES